MMPPQFRTLREKNDRIAFDIMSAEKNLHDARRYLDTGDAVNWVSDRISTAMLWAMEAWLKAHDHEINRGKGWAGTHEAFVATAPESIKSDYFSCHGQATYLHFVMEGGPWEEEEPELPSPDVWKKKAYACLDSAEKLVGWLFNDIEAEKRLADFENYHSPNSSPMHIRPSSKRKT